MPELYNDVTSGGKVQMSWSALETFLKPTPTDPTKLAPTKQHSLETEIADAKEDVAIVEGIYEFSVDPTIRGVERRLRALGRSLASKGVDVEGICQKYDSERKGYVSRSNLVDILMQLGVDILEAPVVVPADDQTNTKQRQQQSALDGGMNSFAEHMESLEMIQWYRDGQKRRLLKEVLSRNMTTRLTIPVTFGQTSFVELPITNPYNHEERYGLSIYQCSKPLFLTELTLDLLSNTMIPNYAL